MARIPVENTGIPGGQYLPVNIASEYPPKFILKATKRTRTLLEGRCVYIISVQVGQSKNDSACLQGTCSELC